MQIGRIKKWAEFQHYKDRAPPWIKLERKLLDDYEFSCLQLASKALAPLLWLLASESTDGTVRVDPEWLSFRLRWPMKDVTDGISGLIQNGFVIVASNVLADCKQPAIPEREGEAERETDITNPNGLVVRTDGPDASQDEKEVSERATDEAQPVKPSRRKAQGEPCPTQKIIDLYHQALPELKEVRVLSAANAGHVRQLWRTHLKSLEEWERFFGFIRKSDFLMGRTSSAGRDPFVPTLVWLVKPENFANIANRKYHS